MRRALARCLLAMWLPSAALATDFSQAVQQALTHAQQAPEALAQPHVDAPKTPELLQRLMSDPPVAWRRIDHLRHWPAERSQPSEVYRLLSAQTPSDAPRVSRPLGVDATAPPVAVPDDIPEPLAQALRNALYGLALADAWRVRTFADWPSKLTPNMVLVHTLPAAATQPHPPPPSWPDVDPLALRTGMRILLATAERLHDFVTQTPHLPPVYWRADTPHGTLLVDTTGRDNQHHLSHPYLVLDVGGNDQYDFDLPADGIRPGVRLLMDHGGHDRYRSRAPGSDPSGALLGYALLWDTEGDDDYQAGWLAQGAAVLGAAAHIDDAGNNRYHATGMAQGFALAGDAMLLGSPGNDHHRALTMSQASAGPQGHALLLEPGGHDHYHLGNEVLVWPSSQLPERNASMGQGAGFGTVGGGGVALLIDAEGDDQYDAHVFAQGAGLRQGLGALVDLGGSNRHRAAWYAMGAAAHQAVGVLWAAGIGDDTYDNSHVTAMGAGHDHAVGLLVDGGGSDHFVLADLGLGAAHDGGHGVLARTGGRASYRFTGPNCRGAGQAHTSTSPPTRAGLGVFFDGTATPPCRAPANLSPSP